MGGESGEDRPQVLMIAARFPPENTVGARRVAGFAQHLPDHGWDPLVVTTEMEERYHGQYYDAATLTDQLREMVVMRVPWAGCRAGGRWRRWECFLRAAVRAPVSTIMQGLMRRPGQRDLRPVQLWREGRRARRFFRDGKHNIRLIYATSPSNAALKLASELHRETGVPWVADMRDDIAQHMEHIPETSNEMTDRERDLLRTAARVVTVSNGCAEAIGERIGRTVDVVTNGYDGEFFPQGDRVPNERFTVRYTGKISHTLKKNPAMLLEALRGLQADGKIAADNFALEIYGPESNEGVVRDWLSRHPSLAPLIHRFPNVEWRRSRELQQEAEALLLLTHQESRGILTAKVFEYLQTGRPILSVPGDAGECDALLRAARCGFVPKDAADLAEWFLRQMEWWREGVEPPDLEPNTELISGLSRHELTGRLAGIFKETVTDAGNEGGE